MVNPIMDEINAKKMTFFLFGFFGFFFFKLKPLIFQLVRILRIAPHVGLEPFQANFYPKTICAPIPTPSFWAALPPFTEISKVPEEPIRAMTVPLLVSE